MRIYRIVKNKARTTDLSGTGGRWNSIGTYMLYTSESSSLALLETLVHFDVADVPPNLYLMHLDLQDGAPVFTLPEIDYPTGWKELELLENKAMGDQFVKEAAYLALKVRSAVNPSEYNYLLNPLFPRYHDLVKVLQVDPLPFDRRLVKGSDQ